MPHGYSVHELRQCPALSDLNTANSTTTAAQNYLAAQGVTRTRLNSTGRGEAEPVATNDTDAGRQTNRRVEIAIYANETLKTNALRSGM